MPVLRAGGCIERYRPNSKLGEQPIRSTGPSSTLLFPTAAATTNNGILCPLMMTGQTAVLGFVPAHKGLGLIVAVVAAMRRTGPRRPPPVGYLRSGSCRHGPGCLGCW